MANKLRFNTEEPQPFRDMGGDHVCAYAGRCSRCNRRVYGIAKGRGAGAETIDPDPRGAIPPTHALSSMIASEYDMSGPDMPFCWDCVNEHGAAVYHVCLGIARGAWIPIPAEVAR